VLDLQDNAPIQLAYCWAHARRKLFDLTHHNVAPIAEEGLKQIAALYQIEKQARGTSAKDRLALRQTKSAPKIITFKVSDVSAYGSKVGLSYESVWLIWLVSLCGALAVMQAACFERLSFDHFPLF
jgi:Flp pilus assembly protein TadB